MPMTTELPAVSTRVQELAQAVYANTTPASENGLPMRELGRTGERVSILCLGGWHIGAAGYGQPLEPEAIRIMHTAIDEGVIRVVTQSFEGHSKCRTLEELLELLDPALFWRAHRGFVVNIDHIREVVPWFKSSYQLRMNDKKQTEIPVSRAQTKRLRELFNL